MITKTHAFPLVACVVVLGGNTFLMGRPEQPKTGPAPKPAAASSNLKRWKMPPVTPPKGEPHFPLVNSAAMSDDGTRLIIDNHPAVDIWDTEKVQYTRVVTDSNWGIACNVLIAQDASRVQALNAAGKKLETYSATGSLTKTQALIGLPAHGLRRAGYDFASRDYVMGTNIPNDIGIFEFDPDNGLLKLHVRFKDLWDTHSAKSLLRLSSGEFLVYYNAAGGPNNRKGLFNVAKDGTFTKISGMPSKDMRVVEEVTISADGRYLAFLGSERLEVWERAEKKLVLDWRQEYRDPRVGRFTGDGRLAILSVKTSQKEIATSGLTGGYVAKTARLDVLEIPSLRVSGQLSLEDFESVAPIFAFSPNGRRLVVTDPKQVALIDVARTFPAK